MPGEPRTTGQIVQPWAESAEACQPRSSPGNVRHSRRMTRNTLVGPHPRLSDHAARTRSMSASTMPAARAGATLAYGRQPLATAARRTSWNARTGLMCVPVPLQVLPAA